MKVVDLLKNYSRAYLYHLQYFIDGHTDPGRVQSVNEFYGKLYVSFICFVCSVRLFSEYVKFI